MVTHVSYYGTLGVPKESVLQTGEGGQVAEEMTFRLGLNR